MARVQATSKKLLEVLEAQYPQKKFALAKAQWHPEHPIQGVISIDGQDLCALKAESQFAPPEVFWAPGTDSPNIAIDKAEIAEKFELKLQANSGQAHVDTTMWCK